MAAVEVTISGVLFDKTQRTAQSVVLIGEATLTGLGVGGGPMPPGQGGGLPPTWGGSPGGDWPGVPTHPIQPVPPFGPAHPIVIPPPGGLPGVPTPPNPGDPTTPMPPPAGSAGWPVTGIVPPPYVVINYPGVGPVIVAPPVTGSTSPT